jgi:hypothetical protein
VTLEGEAAELVLLIWPSEGTSWDSQSRVIESSEGNRTVEPSDGEEVSFGGGGRSVAEWIDSVDSSASEPYPSCLPTWDGSLAHYRPRIQSIDLAGLTEPPSPNTIAWLVWHLARVQDHHVAELLDTPQIRLVSIADDSLQHAGQAAYVRGLLGIRA